MAVQLKKMTLTPTLAKQFLERNQENRPFRRYLASQYAESMRRGEWLENAETLKFNCDDIMIDGQHRCHAVIESGVSVPVWVATGITNEAFDTIDQGLKRTLSDVLARHNEKHYATLAGAVRTFYFLKYRPIDGSANVAKGGSWKIKVTPAIALSTLEKHPILRESVEYVIHCDFKRLWSASLAAALHSVFAEIDRPMADDFMGRLGTGERLEKGEGLQQLRKMLTFNVTNSGITRYPTEALITLTVKCWNNYRTGTPKRQLRWQRGEFLPEPV